MHIAPDRYDAAVAHLRGKGQEVVEHDFPGYGGSRAAYVDDPDGNVVELWTWDVARHLTSAPDHRLQTDRDDLAARCAPGRFLD